MWIKKKDKTTNEHKVDLNSQYQNNDFVCLYLYLYFLMQKCTGVSLIILFIHKQVLVMVPS